MYPKATGLRHKLRSGFLIAGLWLLTFFVRAEMWSTGYYPGWEQQSIYPASKIDFTALTHIIHFSVVPTSSGGLNSTANSITNGASLDIISQGHAAGLKVLICVGGANTEGVFLPATTNSHLATFITSLTNFMASRGYDGIDVDWEPLPTTDFQQFTNLINGLRAALDVFPEHKLLTVAAGAYPNFGDPANSEYVMYASVQSKFDQINIMTYDLSGPFGGWVTWFDSPIFDAGFRFPSTGGLVPSIDGAVKGFTGNGVAASKLGIGIPFYGYTWLGGSGTTSGGVTQPRQGWTTAPTVTTPSYSNIVNNIFQASQYRWDTNAQTSYLTFTNASAANDMFVSYEDARACQAKVSYARNHGLGGVMIWELALDYQPGQSDVLLQAVKQAIASPGPITIESTNQNVALTFSGVALGSYRVQWTDALTNNSWNTLVVTNVTGTSAPLQIVDPNAFNASQRFYRVQSPQ